MSFVLQQNKRFIIVAHEDDYMLVAHAMHAGVPVQNAEFVLTSILRQQIDYDQFALAPPPTTQQHGLLRNHHLLTFQSFRRCPPSLSTTATHVRATHAARHASLTCRIRTRSDLITRRQYK